MGTLADDLKMYANEAYTKKDIRAGLKLIAELAGTAAFYGTLVGVGVAISSATRGILGGLLRGASYGLANKVSDFYVNCSAQDRRYVRAAVRWLNPISLVGGAADALGFAADVDYLGDIVDAADTIGEKAEDIDEWLG